MFYYFESKKMFNKLFNILKECFLKYNSFV